MRMVVSGLVVATLSLAGCAQARAEVDQPEVAPSVSLPADPHAALAVGAEKLGTQSARISYVLAEGNAAYETKLTGVVDATGLNYELASSVYVVRRAGDDVWLKVLRRPPYHKTWFFHPEDLNKWIKLTVFNIETTTTFRTGFPWKLPRGTVTHGTKVTRVGERSFRGTTVRKPAAKDGHFAAELDQAGRLTRVSSGFGASDKDLFAVEFSDFGLPVTIEPPPAAEISEREYVSTVDAGIL